MKQRMKAAQDRYKSYAYQRRCPLVFEIGDRVFLMVSPVKGVHRFGVKGKLSPRYIGPYEILERIGPVAYRLALPPSLSEVHNVFHISQLRKCLSDPEIVIEAKQPEIQSDLTTLEQTVEILERTEKVLRNKMVPLVKVLWKGPVGQQSTWEVESTIRKKYPALFS